MDENRDTNWGFLAFIGAALFAALVYGVASAGRPPSMDFAVPEALLLVSVLAIVIELFVKSMRAR